MERVIISELKNYLGKKVQIINAAKTELPIEINKIKIKHTLLKALNFIN